MKNFKLIVFILLIVTFFVILFFGIFGFSMSFLSSKEIKENRELKENLITELKINNTQTIYDKNNNIYYYMVDDKYENQNYILKLELDFNFKYKFIGKNLNIINVQYDKPIDVIFYNDKYYYETKIQLTNLPLINIETENEIGMGNENTVFTYINQKNIQKEFVNESKIKVRGATSYKLEKKSYRINFYNKTYTKEEKVSVSNFYIGDSLILDALYRDHSKIRNLLSTELWNDISKDFSDVRIYSEFVEVFINNEYKGLYLLTEPVNRTKLNLNKTTDSDSSFIVKSTLGVHEVKYPNDETYILDAANKTKSIVSKYMSTKTDSSYDTIINSFDINNYIDIIIFNYFTNNLDNRLEQNVYYYNNSLNENIVYVQPWDMEWTFGITPGDNQRKASIFDCFFYHPNAPEINELIINRYWELRGTILTEEYFNNLINKYLNELGKGSTSRDSEKWYEYSIEKELEYIRNWIKDRIKFTDEKIKEIENE